MEYRTAERYSKEDKQWIEVHMKELKKGDIFRLFESDGTPVEYPEGHTIWSATGDAYLNKNSIWQISIRQAYKDIP